MGVFVKAARADATRYWATENVSDDRRRGLPFYSLVPFCSLGFLAEDTCRVIRPRFTEHICLII